ncbi:DUF4837 family protein [Lutimonas sp.]|uniref:DUF4837 family protein n=1 Tax=Lutimonas sp. TaxID=1872403 RepID=UPI003D9BE153
MFKRITLLLFCFSILISCGKSDTVTLVSSTGRINHVLIVINDADWDGRVGDALKEIIGEPVIGLPQEENQFTVTQVDPRTFNALFKRNRNILFVGVDTINQVYTNSNIYSSPQTTLTILAKDKETLIKSIADSKDEILNTFKKNDLALYQRKITKDLQNIEDIQTLKNLGISLQIPFDYKLVDDTGQFLWYRNSTDRGLLNIIAYEIPTFGEPYTKETLVSFRDSIGKNFIPGQFDNTYMRTEPNFTPITTPLELNGMKAIESRGLWFVEGDFMGGPYLSYTLDDAENERLIVIEGFSYSPSSKKRDVVFQLEAILKTVQKK